MANFSDIAIRIAADFVGIGAFKKADTAVDKLYKSTKRLGAAFGVTFSAAAIARFGAESVRAFANEERQVASLTATVKSLGLAFRAGDANAYIEDLERLTGIAREELQPAFQKLITQTGSITKAQKILSASIKVSMSGLMSTEEAAQALTQAYVGNVKGLKQFNLGLTNAELAALSFDQVLQKVAATYDSQFDAALDTTQIKIDKFNVAVGNAKENIGSGLVDAFGDLAGNGNLDAANQKIERFSLGLADVIRNGNILAAAEWFANPVAAFGRAFLNQPSAVTKGANLGSPAAWRTRNAQIMKERQVEQNAAKKLLAIENAKAKTLAKQTAEKKAQVALDKANVALGQAENVFDLERINIAAAMATATLTDNERKRLEIKQAIFSLEDAIASKDTAKITAATTLLNGLLSQFSVMQSQAGLLEKIKVSFDALGMNKDLINLSNLEAALRLIEEMQKRMAALSVGKTGTASVSSSGSALSGTPPYISAPYAKPISEISSNASIDAANAALNNFWDNHEKSISMNQTPVVVQITENAQKLVDAVTFAAQNSSANGNPIGLYRNAQNLAW